MLFYLFKLLFGRLYLYMYSSFPFAIEMLEIIKSGEMLVWLDGKLLYPTEKQHIGHYRIYLLLNFIKAY